MASNQKNDPKTGGRVKVEPLPPPAEELSAEEAKKVQGGLKQMGAGTPVKDPLGPPVGIEHQNSDKSDPTIGGYAVGG